MGSFKVKYLISIFIFITFKCVAQKEKSENWDWKDNYDNNIRESYNFKDDRSYNIANGRNFDFGRNYLFNNSVVLSNKSNSTINFQHSSDKSNWVNQSISPNDRTAYFLDVYIKLTTTGSNPIIFSLKAGNTYFFDWNKEENKWYVFEYSKE